MQLGLIHLFLFFTLQFLVSIIIFYFPALYGYMVYNITAHNTKLTWHEINIDILIVGVAIYNHIMGTVE